MDWTDVESLAVLGPSTSVVFDLAAIQSITDAGDQFRIDGGDEDEVLGTGGWTAVDTDVTLDGASYTQYEQGGATLLVNNAVDQSGINSGGVP